MAEFVNNNVGMDWTDTIESDGQEFILLPEGDYNFVVSGAFSGERQDAGLQQGYAYSAGRNETGRRQRSY